MWCEQYIYMVVPERCEVSALSCDFKSQSKWVGHLEPCNLEAGCAVWVVSLERRRGSTLFVQFSLVLRLATGHYSTVGGSFNFWPALCQRHIVSKQKAVSPTMTCLHMACNTENTCCHTIQGFRAVQTRKRRSCELWSQINVSMMWEELLSSFNSNCYDQ